MILFSAKVFSYHSILRYGMFIFSAGHIFINFEHKHDYSEIEVIQQNPNLLLGGAWRPRQCVARHKVAIIIPYRDRKEHLIILLSHLHLMLRRQQLDYRIYVIEQVGLFFYLELI